MREIDWKKVFDFSPPFRSSVSDEVWQTLNKNERHTELDVPDFVSTGHLLAIIVRDEPAFNRLCRKIGPTLTRKYSPIIKEDPTYYTC